MKERIKKLLQENTDKPYRVVTFDEFDDAILELTTLDVEDSQVRFPKSEDLSQEFLFNSNGGYLYLLRKDSFPEAGSFEIIVEDINDEVIGFLRGTVGNKIISFNMVYLVEESRGNGIMSGVYREFLKRGYTIKSDNEISDGTYSVYRSIVKDGATPIIFNDGTVGMTNNP